MNINPKPGEVYFVDLGMAKKPRNILVVSVRDEDAPLAVISGLSLTRHYHQSSYEVVLPKLPWMREQSYVNAQSLGSYKFVELQRLQGKLESGVMDQVRAALSRWIGI